MVLQIPSQAETGTSNRPVAGTLWVATTAFWMRHAFALIARLRGRQVDSPQDASLAARATGSGGGS